MYYSESGNQSKASITDGKFLDNLTITTQLSDFQKEGFCSMSIIINKVRFNIFIERQIIIVVVVFKVRPHGLFRLRILIFLNL